MASQTTHLEQACQLFEAGNWQEAISACEAMLTQERSGGIPHLIKARSEVQLDQLEAARNSYLGLLALEPDNFNALLEIGNVLRRQGEAERAGEYYIKASQARPGDERGYVAAARLFEESGDLERGAACLHRAFALLSEKPTENLRLAHRMGRFRLDRGDIPRALDMLHHAYTQIDKNNTLTVNEQAEILIDLSDALLRINLREEAFPLLQEASKATECGTLARLADLSYRFTLVDEALAVSQRNAAINPDNPDAHYNLVIAYSKEWRLEEAQSTLDAALAKGLKLPDEYGLRATLAGRRGDIEQTMALYQQMIANGQNDIKQSLAFTSLYADSLSPEEVTQLHQTLFAPCGQGARTSRSFKRPRTPGQAIRIGLISGDFYAQHPVSMFMLPVLKRLDRTRFTTTIYCTGNTFDEQSKLARNRVDHWREIAHSTPAQLAKQIETDQIDILIDLVGHTSNSRTLELAKRLAPAQAIFLGYPGSTGVPNIDWIIADPIVAPPGAEALFSEKIIRLPDSVFCYAPEIDYPYPEFADPIAERPLTFGSFNTLPKLTPHTIRLWSKILKALPASRLLLKTLSFRDPGAVKRYQRLFAQEGITAERLEFRGPSELATMMAEYADIDIALDPIPYNGGTTTLQAMWMGAPVIAKAGGLYVSRMSASFMSAAGLEDWVAADDDEYLAIAIRQAQDRSKLLALKRTLRQRLLTRPAWNPDTYTQHFENALQHIWNSTKN